MPDLDQPPNDQILLGKPLLPAPQGIPLLVGQVLQRIQRPVEVVRQHFLVEAAAGQAATGVAAGKVLVGPAGAVEVAAGTDVEDAATHGEIDGTGGGAVVGTELGRGEGAEEGGRGRGGEGGGEGEGGAGFEAEVEEEEEEGEDEEVDEGGDGGAGEVSECGVSGGGGGTDTWAGEVMVRVVDGDWWRVDVYQDGVWLDVLPPLRFGTE